MLFFVNFQADQEENSQSGSYVSGSEYTSGEYSEV